MNRDIQRFDHGEYDLVVVGGGINGAAITNVAVKNGLKVALLEKRDFASGTSSKSTKLVHGGIRYLENFEFGLVRESLKERFIQLRSLPHLVKPLAFVIPVYKNDRRPLWMMKLGVQIYDLLSGKYKIQKHKILTAAEVHSLEPSLESTDLVGGVMYYDAQMDDARVCLENVLHAEVNGAHVANYVEVIGYSKENGKSRVVKAFDLLGQKHFSIRTRQIVCAGGPWTNSLLRLDYRLSKKKVRLTKGVHLVYSGQLTNHAILIPSPDSKRISFVIPWMDNTLIGTTDTHYIGSPDDVRAESEDIQYLLQEASRVLPSIEFKREKIVSVFAGLRPLVRQYGSPSNLSRKHKLVESFSGILYVIGGKYTTYRKIAEDCVNKIKKIHTDEEYRLYGSGEILESVEEASQYFGMDPETIDYLRNKYGKRYEDVLALTESNPDLKKPICDCSPAIAAQIIYSIETEMAQTKDDILWRRLGLAYQGCTRKNCVRFIEDTFGRIKPGRS